ncbi:MAG: prepilin peptidase [Sphingomonadaceae bacterium]
MLTKLPLALLLVLLALAVLSDLRTRRIPNPLVFGGALLGILLNAALPSGAGLFIEPFGAIGLLSALAGLALGLALLLPMYMLRAMGAGDVKLMAMLGAFVGPGAIVGIVVLTLLAGGVLALLVALFSGRLLPLLRNSYHLMLHSMLRSMHGETGQLEAPAAPSGKLPYAVAIAAGALPYLLVGALTGSNLFS